MEQVNFDQSLRNIPFGSRKEYTKQMTHSIRRTIFNMRWAAAFYLGIIKSKEDEETKETFCFLTQRPAPFVEELKEFSSEVTRLIDDTRWRKHVTNPVQQNLRATLRDIQSQGDKMYVKSDKGDSFYLMKPQDYGSLLKNSLTSLYKKTSLDEVNATLKADRKIAVELELKTVSWSVHQGKHLDS